MAQRYVAGLFRPTPEGAINRNIPTRHVITNTYYTLTVPAYSPGWLRGQLLKVNWHLQSTTAHLHDFKHAHPMPFWSIGGSDVIMMSTTPVTSPGPDPHQSWMGFPVVEMATLH